MQRGRDQGREQKIRAPDRLRAGLPAGNPVRGGCGTGDTGQGDQGGGGEVAQAIHRAVPGGGTTMVIPWLSVN
ncbi:Flagellar hook-associated protein flgK [Stenotrophomonas maltophilia]|nr:Flagellar hook-associated protein flgK [Stenotrophomonas maltophilia]